MTVKPDSQSVDRSGRWEKFAPTLARSYVESYRGPQGEAPAIGDSGLTAPVRVRAIQVLTEAVLAAHGRVGFRRKPGDINVAVYADDDDRGVGPALQLVTDEAPMVMESVTVLLNRLGVPYVSIMSPVFSVRRGPDGVLEDIRPSSDRRTSDSLCEVWIHVELVAGADLKTLEEVQRQLPSVVTDAQQVAHDSATMREALRTLADRLDKESYGRFPAKKRHEMARLLRWLDDGHFVLVGYQCCSVNGSDAEVSDSSRLGVLRRRHDAFPPVTDSDHLFMLTQANVPSYLRYGAYPYVIVVRDSSDDDDIIEHRLVGLFTVAAMNANVLEIPVISRRVEEALARSGRDRNSLPGQLLLDVIQTFPRPELFALDVDDLLTMATAIIDVGSRRRTLLFMRADQLGHFVSALVYLPRDRYTTAVRLEMQDILVRELGGASIDYSARVSESPWAAVHFTIRLPEGKSADAVDTSEENRQRLEGLLTEAARTWADRLLGAVRSGSIGLEEAEHYAEAFPEVYKQAVSPDQAIADIAVIEELQEDSVKLVFAEGREDRIAQLTWFLGGQSASLSQLLPMLQSMGVDVLEERPFTVVRADGLQVWIYQFKISPHPTIPEALEGVSREEMAQRFADAVTAIWRGQAEVDRFNELVLRAGMRWQQVVVLRAYAKYLRQAGFPYSQSHIETVVNGNPHTARALVGLFEALFDPSKDGKRDAQAAAAAVAKDIDALVSLDTDRVMRAFASLVQATLRTNYFVTREGSARRQEVISFKLNPQLIDELPLPRPKFEIFVYSPRVEGVHLRFGPVARGGLRWSDRREDFRTEILGLVKAQAVKNAVIVPVGAKGGFVVKQPPIATGDMTADRETTRDEGVACYKMFIAGLLDITDNVDRASGKITAPERVVRRDDDDAYLVVAADKGTATFSDIANEVAKSYGFWLGDAFASGGSVGYDHKAMGITARGTWESVKRHFREMGVDTQTEDFTVVGIGDMSGDVFGNGMLLSKHIRLIAAFDHRHIFLDPNPDAARSWEERKRLFDQPRSSWDDYDTSLISNGGGVFSREQKSITLSHEVRRALGLPDDETEMTPPELVRAVLCAPVDLLFNGGIGTYVKAESESNIDVGDRSNDVVRVNGNQLRAKVIGEGGNLGLTALGRIEYDLSGGRINTDALDNSAGVDCSDHEVNIKILVDSLITAGKVDADERTALLESMTDEVGELVLTDNVEQNDLMGTSRANAPSLLTVHARQIRDLAKYRGLNRELEALPSDKEIRRRMDQGLGLTSPELATLMAHVKLELKDQVLASELPDQEVFASRLPRYFPKKLRENFISDIRSHQLRREITTTMLVNDVVDCGGITYAYRVVEETGVTLVDAVRTFVASDAIFGIGASWCRIREASEAGAMPVALSDRMTLDLRRLLDRASRWLINYRPQPLAVGAEINRFRTQVSELSPKVVEWLRTEDREIVVKRANEFVSHGASEDLAGTVAAGLYNYSLLDVIDISDIIERDSNEVADTYFALMGHLNIDGLLTAVSQLNRDDHWHALARLAVRDDIYGSLRSLCFDVLAVGEPEESGEEKIAEWEHTNTSRIDRARRTLTDIYNSDEHDLATLSVAARQIRSMTRTGTGTSA
jgi:glutamate dehydrogenase